MIDIKFLFLMILAFSPPVSSSLPESSQSYLLNHIHCEEQVFKTLGEWSEYYDWKKIKTSNGIQIIESQVKKKNPIIRLEVSTHHSLLIKKAKDKIFSKLFKPENCNPQMKLKYSTDQDVEIATPRQRESSLDFTDSKLEKLLKKSLEQSTSGIIYTWSPNMNLSITGADEIRSLAKKHGLELTLLHDSRASSRDIKSYNFVDSMKMRSKVLMDKGMEIHFPSILIYRNGVLGKYSRPGYDTKESLEKGVLK